MTMNAEEALVRMAEALEKIEAHLGVIADSVRFDESGDEYPIAQSLSEIALSLDGDSGRTIGQSMEVIASRGES